VLNAKLYRLGEVVALLIAVEMQDMRKTDPVFIRDGITIAHNRVGYAATGDKIVGCTVGADNVFRFFNDGER